jgi:hypothetical protein
MLTLGLGGRYEVLPRTFLSGDYDFSNQESERSLGGDSETITNSVRMGLDSRPVDWLGVIGNYSRNATDFDDQSTTQQYMDLTMNLFPYQSLRLSGSVGKRTFDDLIERRDVTFTTMEAAYRDRLTDSVVLGANMSRTYEWDPGQEDNIRDVFGLNATMDLTPRITLRANLNVNRNENTSFVSSKQYDASGTLVQRDALAATGTLQPGFTFYDTVHSDLYVFQNYDSTTSAAVWSQPIHFEPVTEQFFFSRNLQLNMVPTDKTSVTLSYTSSASSEKWEFARLGTQTINGSFTYQANRRTSFNLAGTAAWPETGIDSYSTTAGISYRFIRGHQLNASYSTQNAGEQSTDTFTSTLTLMLRKRSALEITYATVQPFEPDQTYVVRVRFSKSF